MESTNMLPAYHLLLVMVGGALAWPPGECTKATGVTSKDRTPFNTLFAMYGLPDDWLSKGADLLEVERVVRALAASSARQVARITTDIPAPPANNGKPGATIPKLIHVTVPGLALGPAKALSIASWVLLNPGHTIHVWNDTSAREMMVRHHSSVLPTYDNLENPVERSDMWRYAVVCTFGGFYVDADTLAAQPIDAWPLTGRHSWASMWNSTSYQPAQGSDVHVDGLVGFERYLWGPRPQEITQWAFGGKPGHPLMCGMAERIKRFVTREEAGEFETKGWDHGRFVTERTGPLIWSDAAVELINQIQKQGGKVVAVPGSPTQGPAGLAQLAPNGGDVWGPGGSAPSGTPLLRVLPLHSVGCPSILAQLSRYAPPSPVLLYHMNAGSWKPGARRRARSSKQAPARAL